MTFLETAWRRRRGRAIDPYLVSYFGLVIRNLYIAFHSIPLHSVPPSFSTTFATITLVV
jgi:hypothetical protein